MSINPPKACSEPGCPNVTHSKYCKIHTAQHTRVHTREKPNAYKSGYDKHWRRERKVFLSNNPLCENCLNKHDVIRAATQVDHIIPHKGNMRLFWNISNWQALCHSCHSSKTAKENAGNPKKVYSY